MNLTPQNVTKWNSNQLVSLHRFLVVNMLRFFHFVIGNDLLLDIISIINKHDFTINEKKLRLANKNSRQTVTGLVVNEKVNVNRKLIRNVRAMIHDLKTNGINSAAQNHFQTSKEVDEVMAHKFISRLYGFIHFIGQVRGKQDGIYLGILKEINYTKN